VGKQDAADRRNPRWHAFQVLQEVDRGRRLGVLPPAGLSSKDQGLFRELVSGVVRWRSWIDWQIDRLLSKPLHDDEVGYALRQVLRIGIYQMAFTDRIPPHAAVSTAVDLASGLRLPHNLVNALLRRFAAEERHPEPPRLAERFSVPDWFVRRIKRQATGRHPEDLEATLRWMQTRAPLTLRWDTRKVEGPFVREQLAAKGIKSVFSPWAPFALILPEFRGAVQEIPGFEEGWWRIQDEAAQIVTTFLDPQPGERVLDACAAPGGKTEDMVQRMGGQGSVVAMEFKRERMQSLEELAAREKIVRVVRGDARHPLLPEATFDRILVDAPCSGSGTWRRHPDGKWLKKDEDIPAYLERNLHIIKGLTPLLKPGGVLVYCTCSILEEEDEAVVRTALHEIPDLKLDPLPDLLGLPMRSGMFRSPLVEGGMDGFFSARFRKVG